MSNPEKKAIVIGSGIAGLASAVRLSCQGYQVEVFEQNPVPGGKLTEFSLGEYRFDFGPSLFTMPQYVEELFDLAGKNHHDYFQYDAMSEACRYFYDDGLRFDAPTDANEFSAQAAAVFNVPEKKIKKYFSYNQNIFENAGRIFLTEPITQLKTWLSRDVVKSLFQSYVIELFRTMHRANVRMLKEERLVQLFDRYATYNGSSPYRAPAILNSISVLEHLYGTYFPKGGMSQIAKSIYQLGKDLGVRYHFNTPVREIVVEEKKCLGIISSQGSHEADVVFCNMDVNLAYKKLLPEFDLPVQVAKAEKSSSAVIFYWGVNKVDKQLGLHNIFFSNQYEKEFKGIQGTRMHDDPTIYINITSTQSKEDAPVDAANWFVMINAPYDQDQNWEEEVERLKQNVLRKLSDRLGWEVGDHIVEERIVTPKIIESQTYSHKGALYGTSSNSMMSAFLRHPNVRAKIKDLYFVGGSVHPGGGIPLCLLSAKIASQLCSERS